jgi:hypothetical protein
MKVWFEFVGADGIPQLGKSQASSASSTERGLMISASP